MATKITTGTGATTKTFTPALMLGYESTRRARTVVSETLSGRPDAYLLSAGTRSGRMELLFDTEQAALECEVAHGQPSVFYLSDPDRPTIAMSYVVQGDVTRTLSESRAKWVIGIGWQEVTG